MQTKIMKFGGTSVGSPRMIKKVFKAVSSDASTDNVIVVSAPSGVTDMLLAIAAGKNQLRKLESRIFTLAKPLGVDREPLEGLFAALEKSLKLRLSKAQMQDQIASFGERFSAEIVSQYFNDQGMNSIAVDSRDFVVTDSNFTEARPDFIKTRSKVIRFFSQIFRTGKTPIVTGFLGKDSRGKTTTLGRGGSDLTATLLGKCLGAGVIEIWTDADGVMTADPRKVRNAKLIDSISFGEVFELSNFGAKVMYSKALEPAFQAKIPIKVKNTFNPQSPGTLISDDASGKSFSVTAKENITTLTIFSPDMIGTSGYMAKLFKVFKDLELSVDIIAVSEASVSVTVESLKAATIKKLQRAISSFGALEVKKNCGIIALISRRLGDSQYLVHGAIKTLTDKNIDIEMVSYGNLDTNLSLVVNGGKAAVALKLIHDYAINAFEQERYEQS